MQPTIIAVVGASGSGKTYLSKLLQDELNVFSIKPYDTSQTGGRNAWKGLLFYPEYPDFPVLRYADTYQVWRV